VSLNDILITPLSKKINLDGNILKVLKKSDPGFTEFGEAYFSLLNFGKIKGWKQHTSMVSNLVVPVGRIKFVFYLENQTSQKSFRIEEIGDTEYNRITVPPGIWFGFQGLQNPLSVLLNIASIEHDKNEEISKPLIDIPFTW